MAIETVLSLMSIARISIGPEGSRRLCSVSAALERRMAAASWSPASSKATNFLNCLSLHGGGDHPIGCAGHPGLDNVIHEVIQESKRKAIQFLRLHSSLGREAKAPWRDTKALLPSMAGVLLLPSTGDSHQHRSWSCVSGTCWGHECMYTSVARYGETSVS